MTVRLGPDGDSSVGLEPVKVLGDPGEGIGCAGFAACRGAKGDDADLGGEAVGLGDDQGAARVAVAGGDGASAGVDAQHVIGNARWSIVFSALRVGNDVQVDKLEVVADSTSGCFSNIKLFLDSSDSEIFDV